MLQGRGGGQVPGARQGLTMMAMPEKSTAETSCQTLGRRGEEGQSHPRPHRTLPSPAKMPSDGWSGGGNLTGWNQRQDYTGTS